MLLASSVLALEVDASYGKRQGEVIYQIGGQIALDSGESVRVRFPLSELRFQINTPIVKFMLNHKFKDDWLASISATKNITSNSGKILDSDWGINYLSNPTDFQRDSLDVYSESRLTLDAVDLQIELQKKVKMGGLPSWTVFIGAGVLLQRYEFAAFDTLQSYPSTPERPADELNGKTLSYRYEASMPFASANLSYDINPKTTTAMTVVYSPWLNVTDDDNHILRNKTSTGDSDGWGIKLNVSLSYALWHTSNVYLAVAYLKMVANGIQTQSISDNEEVSSAEVGLRNTNEQKIITVGFDYVF